jgi:hypothetical protein
MNRLVRIIFGLSAGFLFTANVAVCGGPFSSPGALQIAPDGANVNLSWSGTNVWLQSSPLLGQDAYWANITAPADIGNGVMASFPVDQDQQYFRLVDSLFLPPPSPVTLDAGQNVFFLNWGCVSNASGYNVYYAADPTINPNNYMNLPEGAAALRITGMALMVSNLNAGETYYFVVTAINQQGESSPSDKVSGDFGDSSEVHGSIYTELAINGHTNDFFLPGISITMVNVNSQQSSPAVTTDGDGVFIIPSLPYGNYNLCWSAAGFISGSSTQPIMIGTNDPLYLDPQEIFPETNSGLDVIYGRVTLANGNSPAESNPLFGINLQPQVNLNSNGVIIASTIVNNTGDYIFSGIPTGLNLQVQAIVETAQVSSNINTAVTGEADLVLPELPPVILSLTALWNGQSTNIVPPGSTVQIQVIAEDPNGYPLQYHWFPQQNADSLINTNLPVTTLTVPTNSAAVVLYVCVSDGNGGYTTGRLDLEVDTNWLFTGFVVDPNQNPITDALVLLGTNSSSTDTNGEFSFFTPAAQGQYPLSIFAPGYLPLFQFTTGPVVGQEYVLQPANNLVCTNWSGGPATFDNGAGTAISLSPDSLIDGQGKTYFGPICVSINTYDPCDFSMPFPAGNIATDGSGNSLYLEPDATVDIQIVDGSGQPLALDPIRPATVILARGLDCPPPTNEPTMLPAWVLDPVTGLWTQTGQATRQQNSDSSFSYFAPFFQLGLLAVGQAPRTATVTIVPDKTLNLPFEMRVSTSPKPALIQLNAKNRTVVVPQNQPIIFQVISPNEAPGDYYVNPLDKTTLRKFLDKTAIVQVTNTFTTATADQPVSLTMQITNLTANRLADDDHFLAYLQGQIAGGPFDAGSAYYGAVAQAFVNNYFFEDFMIRNGFFKKGGAFPNDYSEDASALYFNAHDLGFVRSMHMKQQKGADGNMDIAYFVINYRNFQDAMVDHDKTGKLTQLSSNINGNDINTVAMEYSYDTRWKKRYTKFYVFDGGMMGKLRPDADLDGSGGKLVPNLCVTCHGAKPVNVKSLPVSKVWAGAFNVTNFNLKYLTDKLNFQNVKVGAADAVKNMAFIDPTVFSSSISSNKPLNANILVVDPPDGDVGGRFLPFDIESFTYSDIVGVNEPQFRALNRGIYLNTPLTPAMTNLIEGWYGGPLTAGNNTTFKVNYVPTNWSMQAAIYSSVMKDSCRACHSTRATKLGFASFTDFNGRTNALRESICESLKMPNAQRNFTLFWGSESANIIKPGVVPNQVALLTNQYNWFPCPMPP